MTRSRPWRILVYPCGTEIGLEIGRCLRDNPFIDLWGANSVEDYSAHVYSKLTIVPNAYAQNMGQELTALRSREDIDAIFPAHDQAIHQLARAMPCYLIGSPVVTCAICRDKRSTLYTLLEGGVSVPQIYPGVDAIPADAFPVFLKPEQGQGTRGIYQKANDQTTVDFWINQDPTLLVTEYLPGTEYTVDCFTDFTGKLCFVGPRVRGRVSGGIAVHTRTVLHGELESQAELINKCMQFDGPWFFQAIEATDGRVCVTEVASRIAGSSGVQRARGVNLPLLAVYNHFKEPVAIRPITDSVTMDRALTCRVQLPPYDHVFVDLDDTLLVNDLLNAELVRFLIEARNAGKLIHVLTRRHSYPPCAAWHFLMAMADEWLVVCDDRRKSQFIRDHDLPAIFIDDSFAERREVYEAKGIPCYGLDAVEFLHA